MTDKYEAKIIKSWHINAGAWSRAIGNNEIESRTQSTNKAIIDTIGAENVNTVLDIGCGEGWLVRKLASQGIQATGVDAIESFIQLCNSRVKDTEKTHFLYLTYEDIIEGKLIDKFDAMILFIGDRNDQSMIDAITSKMRRHALNTAGMFNLKELAFLLGSVDLMITTDTGPMHIASAMETPVVAIFGPTAPWRTGPYGNGHTPIKSKVACSPCFKKKCNTKECMAEITVDHVFTSVSEKLFKTHP